VLDVFFLLILISNYPFSSNKYPFLWNARNWKKWSSSTKIIRGRKCRISFISYP